MTDNVYLDAVIYLIIAIVVFLLIREILTWYWKLNEIVANQEKTNTLLGDILKELKNTSLEGETRQNKLKKDITATEENFKFFNGKKVVLTGSFTVRPVDQIKEELLSQKAVIEKEVMNDTDILITGDHPEFLQEQRASTRKVEIMTQFEYVEKMN